jgi:hypothetical protein
MSFLQLRRALTELGANAFGSKECLILRLVTLQQEQRSGANMGSDDAHVITPSAPPLPQFKSGAATADDPSHGMPHMESPPPYVIISQMETDKHGRDLDDFSVKNALQVLCVSPRLHYSFSFKTLLHSIVQIAGTISLVLVTTVLFIHALANHWGLDIQFNLHIFLAWKAAQDALMFVIG